MEGMLWDFRQLVTWHPQSGRKGEGGYRAIFIQCGTPDHGVVLPPCHVDLSVPVGPVNLENASQTRSDDSEAHHRNK